MGKASRRRRETTREQREQAKAARRTPVALRRRSPAARARAQGATRTLEPRWNGEPCEARRCLVELDLDGQVVQRHAVEVRYGSETFYLDDEPYLRSDDELARLAELRDRVAESSPQAARGFNLSREAGFFGWGWAKVTHGRGSPRFGHRSLAPRRVVHYIDGVRLAPGEASAAP